MNVIWYIKVKIKKEKSNKKTVTGYKNKKQSLKAAFVI